MSALVAAQHLPGVLHALQPTLDHYGYIAIAALVLLENFGVPAPGETVLIVGAVYAASGRLSILLVALLGFLGAVVGDNIGYAIGRFGGRRIVERFGRHVLLTPQRLQRATGFFERHGGKVVVVARFVEGLRQANGIIAGIIGMRWPRFVTFNATGAALWVAVWTSVGYLSGKHIDTINNDAGRYEAYLAIAATALVIADVARRIRRSRAARAESTA